jgi:hypothetical protein
MYYSITNLGRVKIEEKLVASRIFPPDYGLSKYGKWVLSKELNSHRILILGQIGAMDLISY